MKRVLSLAILGSLVLGVACGKGRSASADTALNSDLSLAAQQSGRGTAALADTAQTRRSAPHYRSSPGGEVSRPARRSSSAGSTSSSQTTAATAPSGGTVEKHTNRDAAIGAAAGAILGATTSKNKVKGGLIGAAVGGVLGGVIGNNVDKKKKP